MSTIDTGALVVNLSITLAVVILLMASTLLAALRVGKHSVIDAVWGAGFSVIAIVTYVLSIGQGDDLLRLLAVLLPVVWGGRLAHHVARRNAGRGEDPRYEKILTERGSGSRTRRAIRLVYVPQGAVMWLVSLPLQVSAYQVDPIWWTVWLGVIIWAVGLGFEAVGDAQLARFKADPANQGKIMDQGLWRYTRHPNYFGDSTVWWGHWLLSASHWLGWISLASPIVMTLLLVRTTGKGLLEKAMLDRPGYREYMGRTSGFLPRPPGVGRGARL